MDFIDFIKFCCDNNIGISAFNTYQVGNGVFCYIMVSQKGTTGQFFKSECAVGDLGIELDKLLNIIKLQTAFHKR